MFLIIEEKWSSLTSVFRRSPKKNRWKIGLLLCCWCVVAGVFFSLSVFVLLCCCVVMLLCVFDNEGKWSSLTSV